MSVSNQLRTTRLLLAPLRVEDIPKIVEYAGNEKVSRYTLNIPHPYLEKDAIYWLNLAHQGRKSGEKYIFSIRDGETEAFMGGIGLHVNKAFSHAELGYWIAEPFWNKGFVSEAAAAVIRFGFEELDLRRVAAHYVAVNGASGKVMANAGMQKEGVLRQHMFRNGTYHDVVYYGILREEL
jgi:RimJ/RimL family protein N-acetyltransferase